MSYIITFKLPDYVLKCIDTLRRRGFEAFAVGGCVRDALMGNEPKDYDVATDALPHETISIFERVVETGVKFGTVTVLFGKNTVEVTTFRRESEYSDSRHPDSVTFSHDITADLSRRDFTVNAMAYSPEAGLHDPFGGAADIENKIIRTVGNPDGRFSEDALRIMRAFRFSARLGFEIEKKTLSSALRLSDNLKNISIERIQNELTATLLSPCPQSLEPLLCKGAFRFLGIGDTGNLSVLALMPEDICVRLAAFLFLTGNGDHALSRFRMDNKTKAKTKKLLALFKNSRVESRQEIKRAFQVLTHEDVVVMYKARAALFGENNISLIGMADEIFRNGEPYCLSMLDISGGDLKSAGIPQGKQTGEMLGRLLDMVIDNPSMNNREMLLDAAKKFMCNL